MLSKKKYYFTFIEYSAVVLVLLLRCRTVFGLSGKLEKHYCKDKEVSFGDQHCPLNSDTFEKLKSLTIRCSNVAYLGWNVKKQKYLFVTGDLKLIEYEDPSNMRTKDISYDDKNLYNFQITMSQFLDDTLIFLLLNDHSYYFMVANSTFHGSLMKLASENMTFHHIKCENTYYLRAKEKTIYYYSWENGEFKEDILGNYTKTIKKIRETKPNEYEIILSDDSSHPLFCEKCAKREPTEKTIEKEKTTTSQIELKDILIGAALFLLVAMAGGYIIYSVRRNRANDRRRNPINPEGSIPLENLPNQNHAPNGQTATSNFTSLLDHGITIAQREEEEQHAQQEEPLTNQTNQDLAGNLNNGSIR